ncbi:hypothetical protein PpBr36_08431 [Pyricularia pennisetigena]|uniref:hypothetical protein n=1 Tax=Pyricularia pennisetigena TaxID=1578925 RepID=UPI001151ACED|nr:hypothetical protein PpBr36_08431 [Pyricularia pennisetigena]TLS24908.1 hypothetical protein PpBr36_08431 [Pyricularia pennisetigena]
MLVDMVDDAWDKLAREDAKASCACVRVCIFVRSISRLPCGSIHKSVSFDASLLAYSTRRAVEASWFTHWGSKILVRRPLPNRTSTPFRHGSLPAAKPRRVTKLHQIPTATVMPDCPDAGSKPFHVHYPTWPDG